LGQKYGVAVKIGLTVLKAKKAEAEKENVALLGTRLNTTFSECEEKNFRRAT